MELRQLIILVLSPVAEKRRIEIYFRVVETSGRDFSLYSVTLTLDTLVRDGFVEVRTENKKNWYKLTAEGLRHRGGTKNDQIGLNSQPIAEPI